jgi:hypothetical protein
MVSLEGKKAFIQAFPVTSGTFIGTATDVDVSSRNIVHAAADGTLTFTLVDGSSLVFEVTAGQDLAIGAGVLLLTSTGTVWIS